MVSNMVGIAAALVFLLGGCVGRVENEVVLYSAADREYAAPILAAFERRHPGTKIAASFDVESTKTVGLVSRIQSEAARPRCDLFWNNEILHTLRLEKAGLLQAVRWNVPADWPKHLRAADGKWIAFAARGRILLINRQRLPDPTQWPQSVLELADEKWKQQCAVALPLFGTTATHFAVMRQTMGPERAANWFQKVKENALVLSGNKQVAQAVSSGQIAFGLTDTDDALIEMDNGLPVSIVFPDQRDGESGTLLIPNTLCILKGCPHPVAARALADYLLSVDIEGRLAMGPSGHIPVRPGHPQKSRAAPPDNLRTMQVDYESVADGWESASAELRTIFRGQ